jgi:DNA-binding NarL/FixJ family response regulator
VLEQLGITGLTARVYTELVSADDATAAEVAKRCAASSRSTTTELRRLTGSGLVFRTADRPPRYRAVAPDLALGTLIRQREQQLYEARTAMHQLTESFLQTSRARHPGAQVEVIQGATHIARAANALHEQARHVVRGFDRPPYSSLPGSSSELQQSRIATGVAYRVIYDRGALAIPGRMADDILPSIAFGEQARSLPELPIKMLIGDDQIALIPAAVTSHAIDTTFVIRRSPILTALVALFDGEWARATPIIADSPGAAPDEETVMLLGMLAAGMTDESVARSLGWSVRTTQRRMRQLLASLGATTRFQAGVAARDRGWL